MPLINFQNRWADAVELGALMASTTPPTQLLSRATQLLSRDGVYDGVYSKRTTIRKPGRARPGDTLYLYTGLRSKAAWRLGVVLCLGVTPIIVDAECRFSLAGSLLRPAEADALARLDTAGQMDAAELAAFFAKCYGLPFVGELILW